MRLPSPSIVTASTPERPAPAETTQPSNRPAALGHARLTRNRALLMAVLTGAFIALRCVHLTADAPLRVHGRDARELYAEPPAKSHEARNWGLFGSFELNPADDYQFWRAQSPAWVYPLAGFFRAFGTDYPQLRTFSTLYSALGLVLLLVVASPFLRTSSLVFIGLALALDPLYFHTSRVGFIEPAVATWATLAVLALLRAERDLRWLALAYLACALAFFTKQAGLYILPLAVFGTIYLGRPALRGAPPDRRALLIVLGIGIAIAIASALYIAYSDYWRAVTHNFRHVLLGSEAPPPNRYKGVRSLLFRIYDAERYEHFFGALPITGLIAVATFIAFVVRALRDKRWPAYRELIVLGWFACAILAMQAIAKSQLRFWTVVIPPAALLAGLGIDWARRQFQARRAPTDRLPIGLPILALIAWSMVGHLKYWRDAVYTVRDGARAIQAHIGDRDATIIGFPSPGIVLGTPYKNFYVRGRFNAQRDLLLRLGVTHLLLRDGRDSTRIIMAREFPELMENLKPELEVDIRREHLVLYDVEAPLRALGATARN